MNRQIRLISQDLQSGRLTPIMKLFGAVVILLAASALPSYAQWTPVWSDEFDGPPASPNTANWTFETGNNNGWGNNEIEFYCPAGSQTGPCDPKNPNAFLDGNGNLVIRALKSKSGTWTSARMKTQGLQEFQYGRVEARIKLTTGPGLWPAFWMLGTNIPTVGWPTCGESDIMEWVFPYGAGTTSSTDHGPGYSGGSGIGSRFSFPDGGQVDTDYHTYGLVWSPYEMQFYRDDWTKPFLKVTPTDIPSGSQWVFNHPFFILLNQAVGSKFSFSGATDATTPNVADMLVDYVRVFKWSGAAPSAPRNLRARARASDQIELKWGDEREDRGDDDRRPDEADAYDIYASPTPNFQPSPANLVVDHYHGTRYIHQGLKPSTTYYYQVLAVNMAAESASSNEASATTAAFGHGLGISMHVGGRAVERFASEAFSAGGFTNFHNVAIDTSAVEKPAPQAVYQTEHWGASDWVIPNLDPRASYLLRLHFVENTFTGPGGRLFNVVINGEQVLTDFDIFVAAGAMSKAVVENFVVKPDENGIVSLQFVQGSADQPTVSGIELLRTDFDDADGDDAVATVVAGSSGGTTANLAINAGCVASSAQSCTAGAFIADADFAGGRSGSVSKFVDTSGVTNPAPEAVYLTQRVGQSTGPGSFGYFIPNLIPGATYTVRLHFAEGFFSSSGMREFNVALDGQTVLSNFDVWATAKATNKAVIEEFSVKADRYGLVMLQFLVGAVNLPSARGIELIETAPPASPRAEDDDE